jgi:hypothetical protein
VARKAPRGAHQGAARQDGVVNRLWVPPNKHSTGKAVNQRNGVRDVGNAVNERNRDFQQSRFGSRILGMKKEVFLEPVPDADVSIARCSICKEQFHSAPLGPRKPMSSFRQHIEEKHPGAVFRPTRTPLYKPR